MHLLALDLARHTGWAKGPITGSPKTGLVTLRSPGDDIGRLAIELAGHLDVLMQGVGLVVYERPVVIHPGATRLLTGFAWITEHEAARRGLLALPLTNTAAKKAFCGRTYSKKDKPYPGIVRAQALGFDVTTTDEADALAHWFHAVGLIRAGKIDIGGDGECSSAT